MSSSSSGSQYMMLSCECLCAHSISGHLFPSGKMMPSPAHLAMRSGGPPLGEKSTFISFPSDPGVRVAASRADEPETGVPTHTHTYIYTYLHRQRPFSLFPLCRFALDNHTSCFQHTGRHVLKNREKDTQRDSYSWHAIIIDTYQPHSTP